MQPALKLKAGVIEGFFGKPWSWSARLSGAKFLGDHGYQFYIYAPKAEVFLRRQWREPMPAELMERLSELRGRCRHNGIRFGIGLTPFEIYLDYDTEARASLRSKVRQIDEIGVDTLCILFDDMRGDIDRISELQANVISDICGWSSAESFIVCPTYYSYDSRLIREFGAPPTDYLRDLGRMVDPRIDFFWTGEKVISEIYSPQHLEEVAAYMSRKPFIWDNRISNDSRLRTNYLFLDPSVGGWNLPADGMGGFAVNPMNQPHLSRIALCAYRHVFMYGPQQQDIMPAILRSLCGQSLAEQLGADIDLFRDVGLSALDGTTRRRLVNRYEADESNPYARDIAAWLRGEYVFDPQCVTS
jgi:hypothetical protein